VYVEVDNADAIAAELKAAGLLAREHTAPATRCA
jgi:hypothetical protein